MVNWVILGILAIAVPSSSLAHDRESKASQGNYSVTRVSPTIPDLSLVSMQGERVDTRRALSRQSPTILQFIFTSCTNVCPVLSATMSSVHAQLDGVLLVSVTIDPEHDTPEVLREYAKRLGADESWRFYTGDLFDINRLRKAFGIYSANKIQHQSVTFFQVANQWFRIDGFPSTREFLQEYKKQG